MVGVSGIRGIVGTDLTPEVIQRYAGAFGRWAARHRPVVVIGRDSRQSGAAFSRAAIAALGGAGCEVIDVGIAPTPTIQLAVEHHHAGGGIAVTASHNPIEWNALKFIGPDGIFLDGAEGDRVLALAARDGNAASEGVATLDREAIARHIQSVLGLAAIDVSRIKGRRFKVALDAVRGAGGAVMPALLEQLGCTVQGIGLETDGAFPRAPEPVPENLGDLAALVKRTGADVGIAVDPDVDRLAIVDETGRPIGEDYTLAFAVRAVLERGTRNAELGASVPTSALPAQRSPFVVCNLSTSLVVEDATRDCGGELVRTPVGEVHVARKIKELGAPIGGEGNGGVVFPALHVGRDAPVAAALLLELLARTGRTVGELVAAAPRYTIVKAKAERGSRDAVRGMKDGYDALRKRFPDAAADTQDGLRLGWRDRWLHVRPSNTEPIIRFIAEGPDPKTAQHLIEEGRRLCAAS